MIKKKQISANYRKIRVAPTIPNTPGLTLGILITGGIGDHIQATRTIKGLIRKFQPKYTELYVKIVQDIFDEIQEISKVSKTQRGETLHDISTRLSPFYDIWVDLRYISKIYLSEKAKSIIGEEAAHKHKELHEAKLGNHSTSWWHNNFLTKNNELGQLRKNLMDLRDFSLNIITTPDDMSIGIKPKHLRQAYELTKEYETFICIHHGAYRRCTTKLWPKNHWYELVSMIKKKIQLPVIQIGTIQEDAIEGAINLLGQTTLQSAALIATSALAYIDTEGGIVHARRAITTDPAIILFGPTPITAFGYNENINISANICKPCWWITPQWATTCPRNKDYACMKAITPKHIFNTVLTYIK